MDKAKRNASIDRIIDAVHPHSIYVFGSHARGQATQTSEHDDLSEPDKAEAQQAISPATEVKSFVMDKLPLENTP